MDTKKCGCCKNNKNVDDYYKDNSKKSGLSSFCKLCTTNRKKRNYYKNIELSRKINRESKKEQRDKDRIGLNEKRRKYYKHKMKTDPLFKLKKNVRGRIYSYMKYKGKSKTTFEIVGITADELKVYLENKFTEGMNWKNYGTWHIDHITPLDSAETEKDLYDLCYYSNLQPMWGNDNIRKGSKILVL